MILRRVGGGLSTYEFVGPVEAVQARDRYGSLVRLAAGDPGVGSVRLVRIDYLPGGATESELSRWDRSASVSPDRLAEIEAIQDDAIDLSDIPEAPPDWFSRAHPRPRFTRGPWFRDRSLDGTAWPGSLAVAALGPDGDPVILANTTRWFSPEEAEANATLMASAHLLYYTLSTAVDLIDGMVVGTRMMRGETDLRVEPTPITDGLRRVLAEARGERVGGVRRAPPSPAAPRPLAEWGEADADVLWWRFPVDEPPYVGSPLSSDWPGCHTHWTKIEVPAAPAAPAAHHPGLSPRFPDLPFRDRVWRINFEDGRQPEYLSEYNGEITGWTDGVPETLKTRGGNLYGRMTHLSEVGMIFVAEGRNE